MSQASETEQVKQLERYEEEGTTHGCSRVAHRCDVIAMKVTIAFQCCIDLAAGLSGETCIRTGHAWDFPPELTEKQQNRTKPVF